MTEKQKIAQHIHYEWEKIISVDHENWAPWKKNGKN
jgi:hypothetical protein